MPIAINYLIGAMILWDILYRSQQGITLSLTEEFWSKNIINIFITPIRTYELVIALCIIGFLKAFMTMGFLILISWYLYQFNLFDLGFSLAPFIGNLILFGWSIGMMTMSLVLRYGNAADAFIWGIPFLIQPISAVFYPVDVLPPFLKFCAYALPSTYIFEGMRTVLNEGVFNISLVYLSFCMNLLYLSAGAFYFSWMLRRVREKGLLSKTSIE
ncbi:MAG: ABC transporter permease [Desulfobacterales bacterium]|nr:ABC transporter permease [Desulfobacterales bacterium]